MSYTVRRRDRELGTRLGIGVTRRDMVGLKLRNAAGVVASGPAVGIAVGLVAVRSLSALLYGVAP